jgi:hypothetical protein
MEDQDLEKNDVKRRLQVMVSRQGWWDYKLSHGWSCLGACSQVNNSLENRA